MKKPMKKNIGSSLNSFLKEEGLLESSELVAVKRLIASQIEQIMIDKDMSKTQMAEQMGTSRSALDRLLDPANISVTLQTLEKAARAVGRRLHVAIK